MGVSISLCVSMCLSVCLCVSPGVSLCVSPSVCLSSVIGFALLAALAEGRKVRASRGVSRETSTYLLVKQTPPPIPTYDSSFLVSVEDAHGAVPGSIVSLSRDDTV